MIRLNRKRNIYMSWNRKSWFTCNDIFYETRKQTVHCYTGDHIKIATDYRVLVDLFVRYGGLSHGDWLKTYSFVEHAGLPVLILACGAVYETVAQGMIDHQCSGIYPFYLQWGTQTFPSRLPKSGILKENAFWKIKERFFTKYDAISMNFLSRFY